ncbi:MAG: DNA polymerase III subunit beta [Clostridia bacterium]|nr:DNA polymerase III subunit beta [Clostridia bacterium]
MEHKILDAAIKTVTKALSSHTTVAILEGIYVEAIGNEVLFRCTDLSLQVETIVNADVEEDGGIVLPGRLFTEMVNKMDGETFSIRTEKNTAHIACGRSKFSVQGERIEDYHSMPSVKKEVMIKLGMKTFKEMIRQSIFATAQDESKPILTGVLVEIRENDINMVALDGYRLAMIKRGISEGEEKNVVVPAKSLLEISRILGDEDTVISITFSRTHVLIDMGYTKITTRLLDGEFIKYKQILPTDHTLRVRVNRSELLSTIDRVGLIAREGKSNLVKFAFEKERLEISADSQIGKANEDIEVQSMGELLEIAFNAKFFTDVLKALDDEYIYLDMNTNLSPCVVRPVEGEAYYYLILPVRMFS